jgi:hypothetical protein
VNESWGAGVRALAADDHPRTVGPAGEVQRVGKVGDLAVGPLATVLIERRPPRVLGQLEDRSPDRLGQVIADREPDPAVAAPVQQRVRGAGRIAAHQDLDLFDVLGRDLLERGLGDRDLVGGGVGAGVARSQLAGQRLAGLIGVGQHRTKPEAALECARCAFLVGVRTDQRGIEIDRQPLGRADQLPRPLAGARMRRPQPTEPVRIASDRVDNPKRGRVRADRPEQRRLVTHRAQITQRIAAVGQHHRQIPNHPTGIMAATPPAQGAEPKRQRMRQPGLVGYLRQQRTTGMRHQPLSVRRHLYRETAPIAHHLQGEPPEPGSTSITTRRIPAQPDNTAPPPTGGAATSCTIRANADYRLGRWLSGKRVRWLVGAGVG